jgi:4-hydroxy-3-methylbut-2-enyl diphosphate reductase
VKGRVLVLAPLRIEQLALSGHPGLEVVHGGMGPRRARAAAASALSVEAPAVAVAGLCAGIAPELNAGDVVCANELIADGEEPVLIPGSGLLATALRRAGLQVHVGALASSEHLEGPAVRRRHAPEAIALDMESAWLAAAAGGRPFAVLRVVADADGRHLADPRTAVACLRALAALRRSRAALADWAAAVGSREVLLPAPRSFCAGVERAIEIVELALAKCGPPVYVRKQIIHNDHVVAELERRGAIFVDELDGVPSGATVVFSAHGVSPAVRRAAAEAGHDVIDATCPLVNKVHGEARRFAAEGRTIFLIGHADHEEVEGTLGEAPGSITVIADLEAARDASAADPRRVAYLTQTTLAVDETEEIVQALRARFPELRGPASEDICYATANRQAALRSVARDAEVVLVVGSPRSSNSQRLVEVARREGARAYLVEDETRLDPAWFVGVRRLAITAGASAPDYLVGRIVESLGSLGAVTLEERTTTVESIRFRLPGELTSV